MTEPDLRTPPGPASSPAAEKRAGPRAVYEAVLRGRRSTIRAKRPYYGVQHNRHQTGVELSPETLAATRAAICLAT